MADIDRTVTRGDLIYVQYLRGIAAVLVIYFHTKVYNSNLEWPLDRSAGYGGVDLFFCISGFIMMRTTADRPVGVGLFLKKRALRIYPLYWLATLLGVALFLIVPSAFLKQAASADYVVKSLLLLPLQDASGTSQGVPFLKVGWTLILEMYFYAVVTVSLLFRDVVTRLAVQAVIIATMCLIGAVFRPTSTALLFYTNPITLEFILGAAVGVLSCRVLPGSPPPRTRDPLSPPLNATAPVVLVVCLGIGGGLFLMGGGHGDGISRVLFFGLPAALVLGSLVAAELLCGVAVLSPTLLLIGNASYAIYLFHPFVLSFVRAATGKLPMSGSLVGGAILVPVAVAAATGTGVLVHLFVERRLNRAVRAIVWPRRGSRVAPGATQHVVEAGPGMGLS